MSNARRIKRSISAWSASIAPCPTEGNFAKTNASSSSIAAGSSAHAFSRDRAVASPTPRVAIAGGSFRDGNVRRERAQRIFHHLERRVSVIEVRGRALRRETPFGVDDDQSLAPQLGLETRKVFFSVDEGVDHVPVEVQILKLPRGDFGSAVDTHAQEARLRLWKRATPGLHLLCDRATSASPGVVKVDDGRRAVNERKGRHALGRAAIGGEHLDVEIGHDLAGQAHGCCGGLDQGDRRASNWT